MMPQGLGGLGRAAKHPLRLGTNGRQVGITASKVRAPKAGYDIYSKDCIFLLVKAVLGWRSTCMGGETGADDAGLQDGC